MWEHTVCGKSHKFILQNILLTYNLLLQSLNDFRRQGIGVA
jgi:hypothetical protein